MWCVGLRRIHRGCAAMQPALLRTQLTPPHCTIHLTCKSVFDPTGQTAIRFANVVVSHGVTAGVEAAAGAQPAGHANLSRGGAARRMRRRCAAACAGVHGPRRSGPAGCLRQQVCLPPLRKKPCTFFLFNTTFLRTTDKRIRKSHGKRGCFLSVCLHPQ